MAVMECSRVGTRKAGSSAVLCAEPVDVGFAFLSGFFFCGSFSSWKVVGHARTQIEMVNC
jgi:hypothetical protein